MSNDPFFEGNDPSEPSRRSRDIRSQLFTQTKGEDPPMDHHGFPMGRNGSGSLRCPTCRRVEDGGGTNG